jgi:hypothetical protein
LVRVNSTYTDIQSIAVDVILAMRSFVIKGCCSSNDIIEQLRVINEELVMVITVENVNFQQPVVGAMVNLFQWVARARVTQARVRLDHQM